MLSFWKVMLKSPTFLPFFLTNLSQKHRIICLSSMKLVTIPQKKSLSEIKFHNMWKKLTMIGITLTDIIVFQFFQFSTFTADCPMVIFGEEHRNDSRLQYFNLIFWNRKMPIQREWRPDIGDIEKAWLGIVSSPAARTTTPRDSR